MPVKTPCAILTYTVQKREAIIERGRGMAHIVQRKPRERLEQVSTLIVVGSGKGGVGKSTVSVNLAIALAKQGARVGLLDGDAYGPSIPLVLGVRKRGASKGSQATLPLAE